MANGGPIKNQSGHYYNLVYVLSGTRCLQRCTWESPLAANTQKEKLLALALLVMLLYSTGG